jgi:anthranilate phosphoribosyltransferase
LVSAEPNALSTALKTLAHAGSLTTDQASDAFDVVMRGDGTAGQIAALLMGLRVKGETPSEVAGAASALRRAMLVLEAENPSMLVDTCGTGGGTVTTFNISTAAALLAAGAGARVAKHGNRSFTSKSGSADVIEALGIAIDLPLGKMRDVLETAGIVFMYAPTMHPAMRHVGAVRRDIAIPTVMNLVGPLANPARAGRQVIGVADPSRVELIAGALRTLGTKHSLVVHGAPGIDELSPLGTSTIVEIRDGLESRWELEPADVGLTLATPAELAGGSPAENAALVELVLQGKGPAGAEAAVVMNAAGAIYVAGLAGHYASAVDVAREALRSGAGREALEKLRRAAPIG